MKVNISPFLPKGVFCPQVLPVSKKIENKNFNHITNADIFERQSCGSKQTSKLAFRGMPYNLEYERWGSISGYRAIEIFENFRLGNYLDLNGNQNDKEAYRKREDNLRFLDMVQTDQDKKVFIDEYKRITGFPKVQVVCDKLKNQFIKACFVSQNILQEKYPESKEKFEILEAGYDGISSVAKNSAFPGSDLDKAYVILAGSNNDWENEETVKKFKAELWKNTDQRVLSYNHDASAFPEVYTIKQINALSKAINKKTSEMDKQDISYYRKIMQSFSDDYVKANSYLVDLAMKFPVTQNWGLPINATNPSREDIYKVSYVLEALFKGEKLITNHSEFVLDDTPKELLNLSQITPIKNNSTPKEKHLARRKIFEEFDSWPVFKQYELVKSMIKGSCSNETSLDDSFKTNEIDRYAKLMERLNLKTNAS